MPDDLQVQVPKLKEVIAALRIPLFDHADYEADDILGALAKRAAKGGFETVIVTTDKDLLQLVDERTFVYNPSKDLLLDADKVKETFGVKPSQVADILSLWGDASDNIPGVPGIGRRRPSRSSRSSARSTSCSPTRPRSATRSSGRPSAPTSTSSR